MPTREFNFDGLIGPTHHYAGLAVGNMASELHQGQTSQPRAAALQGLEKMKTLMALGIEQCFLPPPLRPQIGLLRELGFSGKSDAQLIEAAWAVSPSLVATVYSAASMWTANAATVSPSADCADGRLHFTPANLNSSLHRSIEARSTTHLLRSIFHDAKSFAVHDPLPSSTAFTDEGAANHSRFCGSTKTSGTEQAGIELFVYGRDGIDATGQAPRRFPARQTRLASESIIRRHELTADSVLCWQQNPAAIDAGVFHNDVIAVGNENVFLCHEMAFVDQAARLSQLRKLFEERFDAPIYVLEFSSDEISLTDAVRSYLFNSQLVTRLDGGMTMICPIECDEIASARQCMRRILAEDNPLDDVRFLNLRQSMNNGGGPACLRLRVVLTENEQNRFHPNVRLTKTRAAELEAWIKTYYRESLTPDDLRDPQLIDESYAAIEGMQKLIGAEFWQ